MLKVVVVRFDVAFVSTAGDYDECTDDKEGRERPPKDVESLKGVEEWRAFEEGTVGLDDGAVFCHQAWTDEGFCILGEVVIGELGGFDSVAIRVIDIFGVRETGNHCLELGDLVEDVKGGVDNRNPVINVKEVEEREIAIENTEGFGITLRGIFERGLIFGADILGGDVSGIVFFFGFFESFLGLFDAIF